MYALYTAAHSAQYVMPFNVLSSFFRHLGQIWFSFAQALISFAYCRIYAFCFSLLIRPPHHVVYTSIIPLLHPVSYTLAGPTEVIKIV